ncbi:MAG TPA: hypothetical protein VK636_09100 [Gemmatimonadaceae bacterium]|nr:hypothetical protein [Gemmatimonadaceae bacterium]
MIRFRSIVPLLFTALIAPACGGASNDAASADPAEAAVTTDTTGLGFGASSTRTLPGTYFPESINSAPDGTLFTGNPTTGEIVKFAPYSSQAVTFVPPGITKGSFGMAVDAVRRFLWVCDVDTTPAATGSSLKAFRLADGGLAHSYPLPTGGGCADIAIGRDLTLYVTDTYLGTIMRLRSPDAQLEASWCTDPRFSTHTDPKDPLVLNGIAYASDGFREYLFSNKRDSGEIFRVRIDVQGQCTDATKIALDAPLVFSDGIRALDKDTLLVAVNASSAAAVAAGGPILGSLLRATLHGDAGHVEVIDDQLDQPTSLAIVGRDAWVSEGQILRLTGVDLTPPTLPFKIRRIHL